MHWLTLLPSKLTALKRIIAKCPFVYLGVETSLKLQLCYKHVYAYYVMCCLCTVRYIVVCCLYDHVVLILLNAWFSFCNDRMVIISCLARPVTKAHHSKHILDLTELGHLSMAGRAYVHNSQWAWSKVDGKLKN